MTSICRYQTRHSKKAPTAFMEVSHTFPQKPPIFVLTDSDTRACDFCGMVPFISADDTFLSAYTSERVLKRRVFMGIWDDDMWHSCTGSVSALLCKTCNYLVSQDRTAGFVSAKEVMEAQEAARFLEELAEEEVFDSNSQ